MKQNGGLSRNKLLIITGYARSGTTALASAIFSSNKLIFNEAGFFNSYQSHSPYTLRKHLEKRLRVRFLKYNVLKGEEIDNLIKELAYEQSKSDMIEAVYKFLKVQDLAKLPFTEDADENSKTLHLNRKLKCHSLGEWWGDKVPKLLLHTDIKVLKEAWPDLKIIYIYRDGRDVVASHKRLGWLTPEKVWNEWITSLDVWSNLEFDHLSIRQEDLIENITEVIKDINHYLGEIVVREEDFATFFYKKGQMTDTKSITNIDENKNHIGYWNEYLGVDEVPEEALIWLKKLGYNI